MSPSAKHLSLDGSEITVRASLAEDLDTQASSIAVFSVDGVAREFTASHRGFGADVAADLGLELDEAYSFQGGTLRVGWTIQTWPERDDSGQHITSLLRLGVWEGQRYSVHSHVYGRESSDVVDLFSRFQITEMPHGIRLEPLSSVAAHANEPSILKELPSIGLLDVAALTTTETRRLPKWAGTKVSGGELFTDKMRGRDRYYVLVSGTARTLVMPRSGCDHTKVLHHLERLQVTWQRPSR
jgi:hypothetical protein